MKTGRRPAFPALEVSLLTMCIDMAPRSAVVVRVLVTCTDSTVELPLEAESASIGSSSRVRSASGHHGASTVLVDPFESSNISRMTSYGRALLGSHCSPEETSRHTPSIVF